MRVRTEERSRGDDGSGRDGGKKEKHIWCICSRVGHWISVNNRNIE
jgi:hypothetical protein